jgi:hypothetical protein
MESLMIKILAAFGLDSESLKKLVALLETRRKEYEQRNRANRQ